MTSRQARRFRREQERKAKKTARRAALNTPAPELALEDEFSPDLLAHARAMRERIEQRAAINRANAAHSTGPVTPAGKLASSRNSLKHGLASGQLIIPGEDQAAFEALLHDLLEEHQPASGTEEILVKEMAQSWWLAQRALRLQNDCFTSSGIDEKRLALFLRYYTTHERAFHKALTTLTRIKKDRTRVTTGLVSQHRPSVPQEPGFVSQHRTESHHPSPDPLLQSPKRRSQALRRPENLGSAT